MCARLRICMCFDILGACERLKASFCGVTARQFRSEPALLGGGLMSFQETFFKD